MNIEQYVKDNMLVVTLYRMVVNGIRFESDSEQGLVKQVAAYMSIFEREWEDTDENA